MYTILYNEAVKKDIKAIDKPNKQRIQAAIESKLQDNPQNFAEHLRGELRNYWKLRVGDYRVVFEIKITEIIVLAIIHRRQVYEDMRKRIGH